MERERPPYRPSGLDVVVDAVDRGRVWPPLAYALLAALLVGLVHLVAMADGSLAWGTLSRPLVGFAVWPAYVLAAKAFVRATARRAVEDLCPALTCDAAEVERIRYRLTTQPLGASLGFGAAFVPVSLPSTFLDPHYVASTGLFTSPVATALQAAILLVSLWLTGAAGYGIVHVVRVIADVYERHLRFDALAPQNLFALANLAVRAALAVLLMQYVFVGANPEVIGSRGGGARLDLAMGGRGPAAAGLGSAPAAGRLGRAAGGAAVVRVSRPARCWPQGRPRPGPPRPGAR
ncbi:MAG: hypothetical protein P1P87_09720 [Trueperaceae bacterium]|nr:hypothetical protein [Trueperaceae bacterium]